MRGLGDVKGWCAVVMVATSALAGACSGDPTEQALASASASGSSSAVGPSDPSSPGSPSAAPREPLTRQGSAIALAVDEASAFVADEDHEAIFVVPAKLDDPAQVRVVAVPGPPVQVVALDGVVFVTVRTLPTADSRAARDVIRGAVPPASAARVLDASDTMKRDVARDPVDPKKPAKKPPAAGSASPSSAPAAPPPPKRGTPPTPFDPQVVKKSEGGLLLAMKPDKDAGLVEIGRLTLAPDAWGIAITPDGRRAVVTSAWSHEVAVVDVGDPKAMKVVASLDVAREPRGVAITNDGKTAFVTHLVGAPLTRIDEVGATPVAAAQPLPTGRARGPIGVELHATLAYAPILSPSGDTLFVPRHAIGAEGIGSWWGAPTVDTLDVATKEPLQPARQLGSPSVRADGEPYQRPHFFRSDWTAMIGMAPTPRDELVQPRAAVYRKSTDTILVASEGWDAVTELDALAPDPAMAAMRVHYLGRKYDLFGHYPEQGGAPSGLALTRDESAVLVFCRSTFDVARIDLSTKKASWIHLADDGLPVDAAFGRRLYYNATSDDVSGGLGCAACHPDGRDDGFVWRELEREGQRRFVPSRELMKLNGFGQMVDEAAVLLHPRQTPMLAGRVRAPGPYGWHAEAKDLLVRLIDGFALHRATWQWDDPGSGQNVAKIDYLADYLRSGLLPPPVRVHEPTELEKKGREIFQSDKALCSSCHVEESGFTDRKPHELTALPVRRGFDKEKNGAFKTPSLWFIDGTGPYFHDGSAGSLEALVKTNGSRMGDTSSLSEDDQKALVAYLRTL